MSNFTTLDKIDSVIDELDRLIHQLNVPNKKELIQKIYDFYADVERTVEENF